jgi:hypothetical protein
MHSEAQLTVAQRFRIAKAQARRLLAREWDEGKHPRVPAGSPDGGQFGSGGGGSEGASTSKPGGGKKKVSKQDFDKAKVTLPNDKASQDAFIEKWNDKVGVDPATFKSNFMGGLDGPMKLSGGSGKIDIDGEIHDSDGKTLGTFTRNINLDSKSAYSAYFKLNKSATKGDIGKKMLAGNVETYKNLGIEKLTVTANIDVGGYAWAKYGYVPTASAWSELRSDLERKLTGGSSSSRPHRDNSMEADSWDMLSSDVQDDVRDKWMRETRSEFIQSEEQNWRDSGQAKDDAKRELAHQFGQYDSIPEWANDAFDSAREYFEDKGQPPIPYTNKQLYDAIDLEYDGGNGDGEDDPDISFDDDKLNEPAGYDPAQGTLPGIEPVEPSSFLTKAMRDRITKKMVAGFDKKAEDDAQEIDPPSYLADSVDEYQEEYWDQKDDDEKLRHAIEYGMADIEIEPEEDEDDGLGLNPELFPPEQDPLLAAVRSNDPKSIWKVADSAKGKQLLLGTTWAGVLNLNDKAQMDRFDKYVGKAAHG